MKIGRCDVTDIPEEKRASKVFEAELIRLRGAMDGIYGMPAMVTDVRQELAKMHVRIAALEGRVLWASYEEQEEYGRRP